MGWDKLLKHKSARVIITMDSLPILSRMMFGDTTNEISRAILWFSGVSPVRVQKVGPIKHVTDEHKEQIRKKIYDIGKKAK